MEPAKSDQQPPRSEESGRLQKHFSKKQLLIAGSFIFLLLILGIAFFLRTANEQQNETPQTNSSSKLPKSVVPASSTNSRQQPQSLVYGAWAGQASVIKMLNLQTLETKTLASLSLEIKKVTVLSNAALLYIDQTDVRDHGKQLTSYNVKTKKNNFVIPAAEGFGIDDYVISPNKHYLAIWEVSFAQGDEVLRGGKSRVYAINLAKPSEKKLLYDEVANSPVHYPRAILDNGTVFTDTFLPNDGAGWAYGMSVVAFDGSGKRDLPNMRSGTYGTQPELSPDGKYLVFAGYDGKNGDGNGKKAGFRQAIITSDTVELLNTQTFERTKLPNLSNSHSYATAAWDKQTGDILLNVISKTNPPVGTYAYSIATKALKKLPVPVTETTTYSYLATMPNGKALIGTFSDNDANLGNLGEHYSYPYTQFSFMDDSTTAAKLPLTDPFAQYITIVPATFFDSVLGIQTIAQANPKPTFVDLYSDKNASKKNVQLYTFFLKYDLATAREDQQSTPVASAPAGTDNPAKVPDENQPKCNDVTEQVCAQQGSPKGTSGYTLCKGMYKAENMNRTCDDSPLYLYGKAGEKVHVTIQTPTFSTIPTYHNGYEVTLSPQGTMQINGNAYERITYDYTSNLRRIVQPTKGTIVQKNHVTSLLTTYAQKLGLNQKETADLVAAGRAKVTSPYVFISFFDQQTSHAILPITFSPQPTNYLNVVFYFKLLADKPHFTPLPPFFPTPIKRDGFTAIEVSEMVR